MFVLASCDDEPNKDPFTGSWQFSQATFDITSASGGYAIKNIKVNGEVWTRGELKDVVVKSKIGMLIMSKSSASTEGIVFFNCFPSDNQQSIHADSVWLTSGTPVQKQVLYNQKIVAK